MMVSAVAIVSMSGISILWQMSMMASATPELTGPTMAKTLSRVIMRVTFSTPLAGLVSSS
jgi:hypothetical protein